MGSGSEEAAGGRSLSGHIQRTELEPQLQTHPAAATATQNPHRTWQALPSPRPRAGSILRTVSPGQRPAIAFLAGSILGTVSPGAEASQRLPSIGMGDSASGVRVLSHF